MSTASKTGRNLHADLANRLEQLSPVKRRLLEKQMEDRLQGTAAKLQAAGDSVSSAPLSFNQQRLWFLDRLLPDSARYNVYRAWHIEGPIDLSVLDSSLQAILDRHQVLKMRVRESDGMLMQDIDASAMVFTEFVDLEQTDSHEREKKAIERIAEAAGIPFDLSTGPFLRAMLVRLAENRHILLLVLHHIAADGWSCRVLRHELTSCYAAFRCGKAPDLPDLPLQYSDYSRYQRASYAGKRRETLLDYWRAQLSGSPGPLNLQTDFPRPVKQSDRGDKLHFDFGAKLSEDVQTFCGKYDVTLFMLLTAVLNVLLHRHTGALDILIGSPIANRTRPELESLIGYITNTNVLRTDLSRNPEFIQLLQRVKTTALEAYSYQDMPFEQLVAELQQDLDSSRTPLFQVAFILQNAPDAGLGFQGAEVTPIRVSNGTSKFDLSLCVDIKNDRLSGFWEYCTDLFKPDTIAVLAEQYLNLLAGALADPHQPIAELPLLNDSGRRPHLNDRNAPPRVNKI